MTTDYNPHFWAMMYKKMPTEHRNSLLFTILSHQTDSRITVRAVRDQIIRRSPERLDKSQIRRWVHGKFVTLVRQGLLSKHRDEVTGKTYYLLTQQFQRSEESTAEPMAQPVFTPKGSLNNLEQELNQYRRTMVSQLCEIEEYKRVRDTYPDLGELAASEFDNALEENYRLLGRVKALEKLLANREIISP